MVGPVGRDRPRGTEIVHDSTPLRPGTLPCHFQVLLNRTALCVHSIPENERQHNGSQQFAGPERLTDGTHANHPTRYCDLRGSLVIAKHHITRRTAFRQSCRVRRWFDASQPYRNLTECRLLVTKFSVRGPIFDIKPIGTGCETKTEISDSGQSSSVRFRSRQRGWDHRGMVRGIAGYPFSSSSASAETGLGLLAGPMK